MKILIHRSVYGLVDEFFSWFDSYDIYDEDGNTVYVIKDSCPRDINLQFMTPVETK